MVTKATKRSRATHTKIQAKTPGVAPTKKTTPKNQKTRSKTPEKDR